jgi:hypothetical protein
MATFSLATLRARAQQESDNVNSGFIASTGSAPVEWTALINSSYKELYGAIVQAYGNDYYVAAPYTFQTDGVNKFFSLPTDFFKLLGVDLQVGATNLWVTLKPFQFLERNRFGLVNSPIPMAGQTLQLWYVPSLTELSGDSDVTVDIPNGWEEYIIIDAALKALDKEEADVSVKMARKAAIIQRIDAEAENRDAGSPGRIVDAYSAVSQSMQYRLKGSQLWLIGGNTPAVPYGSGYQYAPWEW